MPASAPTHFSLSDMLSWIEATASCVVNAEDVTGVTLEVPLLKLHPKWHCHHGPYCESAKLQGLQSECSRVKTALLERARKEKVPFESTCPQGIWDLICPTVFEDRVVSVWFLGSLRGGELQQIGGKAYTGPAIPAVTPERVDALRGYGQLLCDTVTLILDRWVADGNRLGKQKRPDFYHAAVTAFIRNRYHRDVRLTDLAEQLHVNPDYLGRMIRSRCGRSFRALLTDTRIEKAKVLLSTGTHNVTETARACGFGDSNYFSTVFRKKTGVCPRDFCRSLV